MDFSPLKASGIKGTYSCSGSPPGFGYRAAGQDVCIILHVSGFSMVSSCSFRLLEVHIGQYKLPRGLEPNRKQLFLNYSNEEFMGFFFFFSKSSSFLKMKAG